MASYIHVCTACGARLTVHERYFGRSLRCTRCRTEFVARVPDAGDHRAAVTEPRRTEEEPSLVTVCGGCGSQLRVRERYLGRRLACPSCGTEFTVAEYVSAPPTPPPRSAPRPPAPEQVSPAVGAPVDQAPPAPAATPRPESEPQPPSSETVAYGAEADAEERTPDREPPPEPALGEPTRSYRHLCTGCGAEMTVNERYYGRTLRCTSCRSEFEADPRAAAAQPQRAVESSGSTGEAARWRRRWLAVLLAVVAMLVALIWWLGGDRSSGFASELFTVKKTRTELGVLHRGGGRAVPVALDREALAELIEAVEDRNDAAVDRLVSSSRCMELAEGTRVRVLERRKRAVETRVRVLDGPWASRIVWVPIQWIR